jgi:hypothetical protein
MYGLSVEDIMLMMVDQNGYCAMCKKDLDLPGKWAIDHNHETGKARGILCYPCNTGLGKLGGDIEGLLKGIKYLEKYGETK